METSGAVHAPLADEACWRAHFDEAKGAGFDGAIDDYIGK